ncbi:hypothetical protein DAI22_06g256100 [Oryza sativa Japonica Group]|nr:hypothetical protein DAI22_06g256100 [Oryza sativa Japonica Group]
MRPPSPAPKTMTTAERRRPAARRRCLTRLCSSARRTWRTSRGRPSTWPLPITSPNEHQLLAAITNKAK